MKQAYFFCLLFVSLFSSAQIINIPDANFKAKLLSSCSTCSMAINSNGQYIKIDDNNNNEIEVSEALNVAVLNISGNNIQSLVGIEYFTNLGSFDCSNNNISSLNLNALTQLVFLRCQNNQLTTLNLTPAQNLGEITCNNNLLTSLDTSNLNSLTRIDCFQNQLTNLNLSTNTNLLRVECGGNQLTGLNVVGLNNLSRLDCSGNNLTNLNLTGLNNLKFLFCNANQITSLNLQSSTILEQLYCKTNQLTSLNIQGLSNLTTLDCSINLLPNLNLQGLTNIQSINCGTNQLQSIDISNLNNLTSIIFSNNSPMTYANIKNGRGDYISLFGNNNIEYMCVDEIELDNIESQLNTYSTVNHFVSPYCTFTPGGQYYTVQGQHKLDNNNNGCDINDNFISKLKFSINDGSTTWYYFSNGTGNFSIPLASGNYTITPVLENPTFFSVTPTNISLNFPTQTSPFTENFCLTPIIKHDVEVVILPNGIARPGFDAAYKIIYRNKGTQTENGTINFQYNDAILDAVSTNPTFTSQTSNNLSFNYSNLIPFETREIDIVLNVNSPMETPAVNLGDILQFTATNTIPYTDETPIDNTFTLKQVAVNSYDPNDKTCLQGNTITPAQVGKYVHYMIRFENTGTFPAENIVVKDMINTSKFDVSSLIPLHASHNYVTKITGNKVEFIFENINLPFDDANNDGYIAFKIKTKPTLVVGNTFSNSANIYFDYNFPIITNTATTTIAALSNPNFEFANYFSLHPNPTTNELNINLKSAIEINSIQIYNTLGQLVTIQTGNALKVDVSNLKTENYFIKINTNEGYSTSQFIKE